jgi:hypothetical protein
MEYDFSESKRRITAAKLIFELDNPNPALSRMALFQAKIEAAALAQLFHRECLSDVCKLIREGRMSIEEVERIIQEVADSICLCLPDINKEKIARMYEYFFLPAAQENPRTILRHLDVLDRIVDKAIEFKSSCGSCEKWVV